MKLRGGNNQRHRSRQLTYKIIYSYKRTLYTSTYCLRQSRHDYTDRIQPTIRSLLRLSHIVIRGKRRWITLET